MKILNLKRIKHVNHIIKDKDGILTGFSRGKDATKFMQNLKKHDHFDSFYSWLNDGFYFTGAYYKIDDTL